VGQTWSAAATRRYRCCDAMLESIPDALLKAAGEPTFTVNLFGSDQDAPSLVWKSRAMQAADGSSCV